MARKSSGRRARAADGPNARLPSVLAGLKPLGPDDAMPSIDDRPAGAYPDAMKVKVIVHEAEEGGFWAEVPALPGCASQGETMEDVIANVREAIAGWLDADVPTPGAVLG